MERQEDQRRFDQAGGDPNLGLVNTASVAQVVSVNPEIPGGTPCFAGTRVPVQALVDHLEQNSTLEEFLAGFPTVSRTQAVAFLKLSKESLLECVSS